MPEHQPEVDVETGEVFAHQPRLEAMSHGAHQRLHAELRKVKALELGSFELRGIYDGDE
jgi:hypothetical protein